MGHFHIYITLVWCIFAALDVCVGLISHWKGNLSVLHSYPVFSSIHLTIKSDQLLCPGMILPQSCYIMGMVDSRGIYNPPPRPPPSIDRFSWIEAVACFCQARFMECNAKIITMHKHPCISYSSPLLHIWKSSKEIQVCGSNAIKKKSYFEKFVADVCNMLYMSLEKCFCCTLCHF